MQNPVDYFEIGTPDPEGSGSFFSSLFGWVVEAPSPQGYSMVDGGAGGLWDTSAMGAGDWVIPYVRVDDVGAAVAKAVDLGGSVAVPLVNNGAIEFAHLTDPRGNRFGVWKPIA
jgi:predicted enzyme related to lactoylglutathione lyase